ncbi:MAG TPA: zinc ribbon domain-containing protein [Ktedonobacteraceae bacterium]|nr:zinc ribbon domain-containing protein [Ktedonobacteraceae bacterium]
MKSITGQYECLHRSGIGLDYFTSRVDRLTLQAKGRVIFVVQERSRIGHAARSLLSGEQVDTNAPEVRREGSYSSQGNTVSFFFDDGTQEQGQLTANGIQIGNNFFEKVSDSTFLPPTQRMQSNMEDIARGLKIAGALGGTAIKAVKTIQDSLQTTHGSQSTPASQAASQSANQQAQGYQAPQTSPASPPAQHTPTTIPERDVETLFCDQCGSPVRPGKRFCNHCGARLP